MELKGARVLIIEGDPFVAMAANMMVENLGGMVAGTAGSVAAAEEKLRKTAFDCVMVDINLRGEMASGSRQSWKYGKFPMSSARPISTRSRALSTCHACQSPDVMSNKKKYNERRKQHRTISSTKCSAAGAR